MILTEKKANPIVDLLINNAIEQIKNRTGAIISKDSIENDLFDFAWTFEVNDDDDSDENKVDLTQLVSCLDNIIETESNRILEEIHVVVERMFSDAICTIYDSYHITTGEILPEQQFKWNALVDETTKLFTELAIQNGASAT